jgi:hypothetical protein
LREILVEERIRISAQDRCSEVLHFYTDYTTLSFIMFRSTLLIALACTGNFFFNNKFDNDLIFPKIINDSQPLLSLLLLPVGWQRAV